MIFDWQPASAQGNAYYDGVAPAFVQAQPFRAAEPVAAGYALVYDPFSFVWVQYGGTAAEPISSAYVLIYDPFLLVWVQYGNESGFVSWQSDGAGTCEFRTPTVTLGTFKADGNATCEFAQDQVASFFWAHGAGGADFIGFTDIVSGFKADGNGTLNFYTSANSLRMQGTGGAAFQGRSVPAPTGFKAQGTGGARFMGAVGADEDCLTSSVPAMPRLPNFVY